MTTPELWRLRACIYRDKALTQWYRLRCLIKDIEVARMNKRIRRLEGDVEEQKNQINLAQKTLDTHKN